MPFFDTSVDVSNQDSSGNPTSAEAALEHFSTTAYDKLLDGSAGDGGDGRSWARVAAKAAEDASVGAIVATVIGEIAYVGLATYVTGDVVVAVGMGVGAGAAIGSELGPIGAAVGAVVGVLVAVLGKPPPTAFQTAALISRNPVEMMKAIAAMPHGRLCFDVMQDPQTAVALCVWVADGNMLPFDSWVSSFCALDQSNGAVKILCKVFETQNPTGAEIDALARVCGVLMYAQGDPSLNPGDDRAVQVFNALGDPSFAATVINVEIYNAVATAIRKMVVIGRKRLGSTSTPHSRPPKVHYMSDITHLLCYIDEFGHQAECAGCTYRQAQIAVQAAFATPVGAEDRTGGVLKPAPGFDMRDNPPPMLNALTLSLNQYNAVEAAIAHDVNANPHMQDTPLPAHEHVINVAALGGHMLLPNAAGDGFVSIDPHGGTITHVTVPRLSFLERLLEWFEYHVLRMGRHEHARPLIPRHVNGVFGDSYTFRDDNYVQHTLEDFDDSQQMIRLWMSDPVRSTIAIEINGIHADETAIAAAIDDASECPDLAHAIIRLETNGPSDETERIAAVGIRLVRMKRAVETLVARACAGDRNADEKLDELLSGDDVLATMARDYVKLAEVEPLQARALTRPVQYDMSKYPLA